MRPAGERSRGVYNSEKERGAMMGRKESTQTPGLTFPGHPRGGGDTTAPAPNLICTLPSYPSFTPSSLSSTACLSLSLFLSVLLRFVYMSVLLHYCTSFLYLFIWEGLRFVIARPATSSWFLLIMLALAAFYDCSVIFKVWKWIGNVLRYV